MIDLVQTVGPELGIVAACAALGVARATYYRQVKPPALGPAPRKHNARAMTCDGCIGCWKRTRRSASAGLS